MLTRVGLRIVDQPYARNARRNLSQRLQPLSPDGWLEGDESRDVAAGPRDALYETEADRIIGVHEYDWNCLSGLLQRRDRWRSLAKNDIRLEAHELRGISPEAVQISSGPTIIDPDIAAFTPSQSLQLLAECSD